MYDYSSYYATTSSMAEASVATGIIAGLMAFLVAYGIFVLAMVIIQLVGMWKVYSKAGEPGWKCLIPIYNIVTLFKIAGISPWLVLGYLAIIVPIIGGFVVLGISIYSMIKLAKAFGQSGAFAAGLILLAPIFMCILGFGKAEYQGPQED